MYDFCLSFWIISSSWQKPKASNHIQSSWKIYYKPWTLGYYYPSSSMVIHNSQKISGMLISSHSSLKQPKQFNSCPSAHKIFSFGTENGFNLISSTCEPLMPFQNNHEGPWKNWLGQNPLTSLWMSFGGSQNLWGQDCLTGFTCTSENIQ